MREIKFRGKRLDNGEWVHGDLINGCAMYIHEFPYMNKRSNYEINIIAPPVDPATVGQYTGLQDKNGVEIYEGDIYHQGDKNILYVVVWHDTSFIGKQLKSSSYAGLTYWLDRIEIIGNIHDNLDLLAAN